MGTVVSNKVNMVKRCSLNKVYKYYFTIVNGLLGLTKKEIDIVARLYYYNDDIGKSVTDLKLAGLLLFSKEYKSKIIRELGIKSLLLNNYISSLKKKNIILVDETDGANINYLNPKHVLDISKDSVEISFTLEIVEEEEPVVVEVVPEVIEEEIEEVYKEEEPKAEPVIEPQATIEEVEEMLAEPKKKRKKKAKEVAVPKNFNPDKPW